MLTIPRLSPDLTGSQMEFGGGGEMEEEQEEKMVDCDVDEGLEADETIQV